MIRSRVAVAVALALVGTTTGCSPHGTTNGERAVMTADRNSVIPVFMKLWPTFSTNATKSWASGSWTGCSDDGQMVQYIAEGAVYETVAKADDPRILAVRDALQSDGWTLHAHTDPEEAARLDKDGMLAVMSANGGLYTLSILGKCREVSDDIANKLPAGDDLSGSAPSPFGGPNTAVVSPTATPS